MVLYQIKISEDWPVFSLVPPKESSEFWLVDIPDEIYKEYVEIELKYLQMQCILQVMYERKQRQHSAECPYAFPKDYFTKSPHEFNKIRSEAT